MKQSKIEYDVKIWNHKTNAYDIAHHGVFSFAERKWIFYKDAEETEKFDREEWVLAPVLPYEEFGLEFGEGWNKLIQPILEYVERYNEGKDEADKMVIGQIKSKFGTLRVYIHNQDTKMVELIEAAEREADGTCEICGSKHDVGMRLNGWITVMCRGCFKKIQKKGGRWKSYDDKALWTLDENGQPTLLTKE